MIETKADKTEVHALLNLKSNIKDTQTSMITCDIIHKQIKHLSVILTELVKNEYEKHTKTKEPYQASLGKCLNMLKQSVNVSQWINNFNPENITKEDLIMPQKLRNNNSLVNTSIETLYENPVQISIPKNLKKGLQKIDRSFAMSDLEHQLSKESKNILSTDQIDIYNVKELNKNAKNLKHYIAKKVSKNKNRKNPK